MTAAKKKETDGRTDRDREKGEGEGEGEGQEERERQPVDSLSSLNLYLNTLVHCEVAISCSR